MSCAGGESRASDSGGTGAAEAPMAVDQPTADSSPEEVGILRQAKISNGGT